MALCSVVILPRKALTTSCLARELGHGTGLAAGLALGKKLQQHDGRVYCLTSDGEWNEGSSWESLIFAKHRNLTNLTIIVDENGLQGFGTTKEVADLSSLSNKFRAFDLLTLDIDGHDCDALSKSNPGATP